MNLWSSVAFADAGAETTAKVPSQMEAMVESMLPMLFIFVLMYFFMIRPQTKKAKEQAELIKSLRPGDEIVTSGGIIGRVKTVADDFVTIESGSSPFKILKEHVSRATKAQTSKRIEKNAKMATASKG